VKPRWKADDAEILVCYDGSDGAKRAVDAAALLLAPRHAVVLNVAPAVGPPGSAPPSPPLPSGDASGHLNNRSDAVTRAAAGAARARRAGLDAEARATSAPATWQGIVAVADELDAAAIVIGAGRDEPARGSVSRDVATHARRPVLIVPAPRQPAD
jgi:nucleotide-binding universal stress UspA family protein